jgi:hypothetical protein
VSVTVSSSDEGPKLATNPLRWRHLRDVRTAWIYLAGTVVDPTTMTRVPDDDWLTRVSTP